MFLLKEPTQTCWPTRSKQDCEERGGERGKGGRERRGEGEGGRERRGEGEGGRERRGEGEGRKREILNKVATIHVAL